MLLEMAMIVVAGAGADKGWQVRYEKGIARLQGTQGLSRFHALAEVAKASVELGHLDEAEALAREALKLSEQFATDWNHGNVIHDGHAVLGRVALRRGDMKTAIQELLLAGGAPVSPQLRSFGPNLALARELLDRGQTEPVRRYLEAVGRIWEQGASRLKAWNAEISRGNKPDFGANLLY